MASRITMSQLAEEAGVSKAVVSAIVNGRENEKIYVSAQTKGRVLQLIDRYGYVPNRSARALAYRRTRQIGVIVNTLADQFAEMLTALKHEAGQRDLDLVPYLTNGRPEREEQYLKQACDGRVDGILIMSILDRSEDRYRRYMASPYQLKIVALSPPMAGVPTVTFDEAAGAREVAHHFAEQNCRRVAVTAKPYVWHGGYPGRHLAFVEEAKKLGLDCIVTSPTLGDKDKNDEECITRELEAVLCMDPLPEAVFARNDEVALQLIWQLQRRGVAVPRDMLVVGCDDTQLCQSTYPTLSSLSRSKSELAHRAIDMIENRIAGRGDAKEAAFVDSPLIRRESSTRPSFQEIVSCPVTEPSVL